MKRANLFQRSTKEINHDFCNDTFNVRACCDKPGGTWFRTWRFLMSVDSVDEADRLLKALPLVRDGLLTFDLMPIGPLLPLGMLMKAK